MQQWPGLHSIFSYGIGPGMRAGTCLSLGAGSLPCFLASLKTVTYLNTVYMANLESLKLIERILGDKNIRKFLMWSHGNERATENSFRTILYMAALKVLEDGDHTTSQLFPLQATSTFPCRTWFLEPSPSLLPSFGHVPACLYTS